MEFTGSPIDTSHATGRRAAPRYPMPTPYTAVRVRVGDDRRFTRTGHVYDLSAGGVMFELDEPIDPGERIEVELRLPGRCARAGRSAASTKGRTIRVGGRVIRPVDPGEPGPARMAVMFFQFDMPTVAAALSAYLPAA